MAALKNTCIFEVESGGIAADANGSLYDPGVTNPGTDYSYGAGQVVYSYTDATVQATTSNMTSIARPFIAADNANGFNVASGGTVGLFEVTAITGSTATCNASLGVNGNTLTAKLGGPAATPGYVAGKVVASNPVWVQTGTYTFSTGTANVSGGVLNITIGGTNAIPSRWEGYQTTRGDKGTRPTLLIPASSVTSVHIANISGPFLIFDNFILDGASKATIRGVYCNVNLGIKVIRVKVQNTTDYGFVFNGAGQGILLEATNVSSSGQGIYVAAATFCCVACISHGNSVSGFQIASGNFEWCISYGNTGATSDGFGSAGNGYCVNCSSYNNGRAGFYCASGDVINLVNCIAVNNHTYGFQGADNTISFYLRSCASYNNSSGRSVNVVEDDSPIVLGGDPFTSAGTGDFSLNNTTGAGAACRAAGLPGTYPAGLTTGYVDVGGAQHQSVAATSAVMGYPLVAIPELLIE